MIVLMDCPNCGAKDRCLMFGGELKCFGSKKDKEAKRLLKSPPFTKTLERIEKVAV